MNKKMQKQLVGYVLRSYPRLSQTFVVNEILMLEQQGVNVQIFAITNPHEPIVQSQTSDVQAPVYYLETAKERSWFAKFGEHMKLALASPGRYFKALQYVMRHPEIDEGYTASSRYVCFLQAVHLARRIQSSQQEDKGAISHLHAHFAHDPTLIALLAHILIGIPYSFTAHARDLYQIHGSDLVERVAQATSVITVCKYNRNYIDNIVHKPLSEKVKVIYCGINLQDFQPTSDAKKISDDREPHLILSVGRLVEKKGFPDLLRACHQLKLANYNFRCVIYGSGPLEQTLLTMIEDLGLESIVVMAGHCSQQALRPIFQQADMFALTPFVTNDGDRDGVPIVLMEAMACGLPVVSTTVAGIPELVTHEQNGLLAQPGDVKGIAEALATLLDNDRIHKRLGEMARRTVSERFDLYKNTQQIAQIFDHEATKSAWEPK